MSVKISGYSPYLIGILYGYIIDQLVQVVACYYLLVFQLSFSSIDIHAFTLQIQNISIAKIFLDIVK